MEPQERFPIGGERQAVYAFMRDNGFIMSTWSDKVWHHADRIQCSIYGAGSMARISRDGDLLADGPLKETVRKVRQIIYTLG